MQKTENYGLNKPDLEDFYNVEDFNENMDVLDAKMKEIEEKADPEVVQGHIANTDNPHEVTKEQVGLGSVPNVSTNNQTPTYTVLSDNAELSSGEKLSTAFGKIAKAVKSLISHLANTSNPHSVTKSQVGLGNCNNTADSAKSVKYATTAGSANAVAWGNVSGKPSTYAPSSHSHDYVPTSGGSISGNLKVTDRKSVV